MKCCNAQALTRTKKKQNLWQKYPDSNINQIKFCILKIAFLIKFGFWFTIVNKVFKKNER